VHFPNVANRARREVVLPAPRVVGRMALITHLGDELRMTRGFRGEMSCLLHRPAHRLLDVHMLAGFHGCRRDGRVHVIRCGDDHRIDVLLLRQHLAVVLVALEPRDLLVDEALEIRVASRGGPLLVGCLLKL
jgi:hypothetical protein